MSFAGLRWPRRRPGAGLRAAEGSAQVGPIDKITLPTLADDTSITPVLSVTLHAQPQEPVPIVSLSRHLRSHHGMPASPDYFQSQSGGPVGMWPEGFPAPAPGLTPPRVGGQGSGVTIAVYDTGLARPAQSNHPPNVTQLTPGDIETLDADSDKIVDLYFGGHEVAIAGVINVIAPAAEVEAVRITEANGVATDVSAARRMATTLREAKRSGSWPDVIVAAFGTQVCDEDPSTPGSDMVPLGLQAVAEAVDRHEESFVVASAGNRSTSRRFYPAAFSESFPTVLAVGALDTTVDADQSPWTSASRTGPRASFSNYGSWVGGWAPGVDLPTNHVIGLRFDAKEPVINGVARVNGTSYAAPLVAGLIAERMARATVDAEDAWEDIAARGVTCSAINGSGVAVALGAMTDSAMSPPRAPRAATDC